MADAALIWKELGADLSLENLALVRDDTLKTAVILSLFIDRRAEDDDELPDNTGNRRGWWADTFADILDDRIGSRLWLLSREKQLQTVLVRAKEYAEEALAWMVEDGVIESLEVSAEFSRPGFMVLEIRLYKPAEPAIGYKFEYLWEDL